VCAMRPEPVHEPGPSGPGKSSDPGKSSGPGKSGSSALPGGSGGSKLDSTGWKAVLTPEEIRRALSRIAHEILERTHGGEGIVLLGIPTRGVHLARRLATRIGEFEGTQAPFGSLDVTMHRDDLRLRPARALQRTQVPSDGVDGKTVVLVDDVLFSGRTIRAALDALNDLGRPRSVQLAVLVDRGHRELPIRADYVGKNLPTAHREKVRVLLTETDGEDLVLLGEGQA
jgi:pyrimidine operon attenuation protein / uracil phosphoribosyltransferase